MNKVTFFMTFPICLNYDRELKWTQNLTENEELGVMQSNKTLKLNLDKTDQGKQSNGYINIKENVCDSVRNFLGLWGYSSKSTGKHQDKEKKEN